MSTSGGKKKDSNVKQRHNTSPADPGSRRGGAKSVSPLRKSPSPQASASSVTPPPPPATVCNGVRDPPPTVQRQDSAPDNPCHELADSLFSSSSGFNNYRGILNLCVILLALATGRVALENIIKYGILINPIEWIRVFWEHPYHWPSFLLMLASNLFILIGFWIELFLSRDHISERLGFVLYFINQFTLLAFPAVVVLYVHPSPVTSSPALSVHICIFLKLISYKQVNQWCRVKNATLTDEQREELRCATATTTADNDNGVSRGASVQVYPENLRLKDIYYFMFAPTLCYELNFPRTQRIRKSFLLKRIVEMVFLYGLMLSLIQQWIVPTVNNSLISFQELRFTHMVERILKLAVPNHFIWLIFFYWMFHSCLNVVAELLYFGDRTFYRDWWNAESVQYFWQTWNIPVHKWALRHLYKPMLNRGVSRFQANVIVFIVSALFHEYLMSIPLRMFRLYAFMGLLGQIPLSMLTRFYISPKFGNMIVWMSLIIGQPVSILMYYHDYYVEARKHEAEVLI